VGPPGMHVYVDSACARLRLWNWLGRSCVTTQVCDTITRGTVVSRNLLVHVLVLSVLYCRLSLQGRGDSSDGSWYKDLPKCCVLDRPKCGCWMLAISRLNVVHMLTC
jgi:hypothetical protein